MASKRHFESGSEDEPDPKRKSTTLIPPASMGPISSLEEMDIKALQFQNNMLSSRLDLRRQEERELQQRIESLEAKQSAADATLSLVNRHWSQLDDNIKVILQRLGVNKLNKSAEGESDSDDESKASFVRMLSKSDFTQIKEELGKRVEFSRTAFGKVIDSLEEQERSREAILNAITANEDVEGNVKEQMNLLSNENTRFQELLKQLHAKHHTVSLEAKEVEQKMESMEDDIEDLKDSNENLQWELQKARKREDRLNTHLAEAMEKISEGNGNGQNVLPMSSGGIKLSKNSDLNAPAEDCQALADSRLKELEDMKTKHAEALKQLDQLKLNVQSPPEASIVASAEYQTLKAQFSLLYHECAKLKQQADDSRALLQQTRNVHMRQIEEMEAEELQTQKKLRNELIQLEDTLAKVRHDYEMLHMEFEQNLAANEQAGPINREMRHLINSLQNHNRQLKGEIQRYKRKLKDLQTELERIKKEESLRKEGHETSVKTESGSPNTDPQGKSEHDSDKTEITVKIEPLDEKSKEIEELSSEINSLNEKVASQSALIETYQDTQGKISMEQVDFHVKEEKYQEKIKELKDKLDRMEDERGKIMKEAISRESELLTAVAAAEKGKVDGRSSYLDNETHRKKKVLEETIAELRKNVAATKQEEEALLSEMDVTGQAFEDMQEQNIRLVQQLREKDDANFKLMSERIKANQIQKLLREEKDVLQDQTITLHSQVESQNLVVRRLEEKERAMQTTIMQMEKEMVLRTQALDLHKRKAFELSQLSEDLQRDLGKARERARIAEVSIDRKIETIEEENFKLSRAQEESARLRRKLERQKKNDIYYNSDEIMLEEIKEYKTKLRCPCCNVNNKDAVLTKCFHVFCLNCIKTRYETRQRKCPKCNAGFGGNDFHRIYIE